MINLLSSLSTILITVFIFGILIFVHELGHYIVARKTGVGILEFAIGMGPKLFSWEGKHNLFSIRAFPIGGFVSMVGEYSDDIPEKVQNKTPLDQLSPLKRIAIAISGPGMNFLLGLVVMAILTMSGSFITSTVVARFDDDAISNSHGLMENDEIIKINNKRIHVFNDLSYKIMSDGINPLEITVIRDGETVVLHNVSVPIIKEKDMEFGTLDFKVWAKEKTFTGVLHQTIFQTASVFYLTVDSLIDAISGRYGASAVSGPIGIGSEVDDIISSADTVSETVFSLATITVFISISLGIFNLLPIPVLDGGMILFSIIELIRRKPMDKKVERTVSGIFMVLLMTATVLILFKDLISLF